MLVLVSNQELGTGGPEDCSKFLKWRTSSTPGTTFVNLIGYPPVKSHSAEADCLSLLRITEVHKTSG